MEITKNWPFDKNVEKFGMMPTSCRLNAKFSFVSLQTDAEFISFLLPD